VRGEVSVVETDVLGDGVLPNRRAPSLCSFSVTVASITAARSPSGIEGRNRRGRMAPGRHPFARLFALSNDSLGEKLTVLVGGGLAASPE
jgi:hypothetical protein